MLLSADRIRASIEADGGLSIDPFDPRLLKPASYVLRLDRSIRRWPPGDEPIVLWDGDEARQQVGAPEECETIVIEPRKVVLASTLERIAMPWNLAGLISTLSHLARCGVSVHCNSYLVSPGWGHEEPTPLTLELTSANNRTVVLRPGEPICHLMVVRVHAPDEEPDIALKRSAYEGDTGPEGPKYSREFEPLLARLQDLQ